MIKTNPEPIDLREFLVRNTVFKHLSSEELELIPVDDGPDQYKRGEIYMKKILESTDFIVL